MAGETNCEKCGTPLTPVAHHGVCPKCLFGQALAADSAIGVSINRMFHALNRRNGGVVGAPCLPLGASTACQSPVVGYSYDGPTLTITVTPKAWQHWQQELIDV